MITLFALVQLPGFAQDWNIQTIGNGGSSSQKLLLDDNGIPHCIVNHNYFKWNGVAWDQDINDAFNSCFCIDEFSEVHFATISNNYLLHHFKDNGVHTSDTVCYAGYYGSSYYSIYYDLNSFSNKPSILYGVRYFVSYTNYRYHVKIGTYDNTLGAYTSITLFDISDNAQMSYPNADYCTDAIGNLYYVYTGSAYEIVFNFFDGTTWSSFNITDGTNDCQYPRITLDQDNIPHVSYYDMVTKDLIHAKLPAQTMMMLKEGKLKSRVPSQIIVE